ncbi:MAG TPA: MraY family glycosyltransferase [Candidatus Aquilonibacter sp.]|nr:MraY family glycosyltransferase [Candidatus Aquilonibacter sp.]
MTPYSDLIAFAVALLGSLGLTIPVRRLALRYGMVDKPGPRKVHLKPIPLLGGIAIYLGFVLAVVLTLRGAPQQQIAGILAGATLLATVGILDDGGVLHHQVKLFIGMPAAACFLLASGIRAQFFSVFIHGTPGVVLDSCFTVFWVVGITASFSILDHMDGLCAGIAAVGAAFFTISAAIHGQMLVQTLGAATFGAALGFLRWNFNPAKIFMGDGGAMFLGFLMATLGLKIRVDDARFPSSWLVPVLILGVPIFDTAMVSISRSRRGLLPFTSPGKDHTAHRLSNLGLGHRGAVVVLYALAGLFGSAGILVPYVSPAFAYLFAAIAIVIGLFGVAVLENLPYERQMPKAPTITRAA